MISPLMNIKLHCVTWRIIRRGIRNIHNIRISFPGKQFSGHLSIEEHLLRRFLANVIALISSSAVLWEFSTNVALTAHKGSPIIYERNKVFQQVRSCFKLALFQWRSKNTVWCIPRDSNESHFVRSSLWNCQRSSSRQRDNPLWNFNISF
jgi:hypothetical protein